MAEQQVAFFSHAAVQLQPVRQTERQKMQRESLPASSQSKGTKQSRVVVLCHNHSTVLERLSVRSVCGACHVGPAAAWCQPPAAVAANVARLYKVLRPFMAPEGRSWTLARPCSCIVPSGTESPALQVDSPIHFTQPGGVQVKADGTAQVRDATTLPVVCPPLLNWCVPSSIAAACTILYCGKDEKLCKCSTSSKAIEVFMYVEVAWYAAHKRAGGCALVRPNEIRDQTHPQKLA